MMEEKKKKKEVVPFVTLDLDKPRKLRFDLNSLIEIRSRYSICTECNKITREDERCCDNKKLEKISLSNLNEFMKDCAEDPEKLRFLFWIGLKWEDKELTEEQVGTAISFEKILEMSDMVVSQFEDSVVDEEGKKDKRVTEEKEKSGPGQLP